jgi:hypothetical protein
LLCVFKSVWFNCTCTNDHTHTLFSPGDSILAGVLHPIQMFNTDHRHGKKRDRIDECPCPNIFKRPQIQSPLNKLVSSAPFVFDTEGLVHAILENLGPADVSRCSINRSTQCVCADVLRCLPLLELGNHVAMGAYIAARRHGTHTLEMVHLHDLEEATNDEAVVQRYSWLSDFWYQNAMLSCALVTDILSNPSLTVLHLHLDLNMICDDDYRMLNSIARLRNLKAFKLNIRRWFDSSDLVRLALLLTDLPELHSLDINAPSQINAIVPQPLASFYFGWRRGPNPRPHMLKTLVWGSVTAEELMRIVTMFGMLQNLSVGMRLQHVMQLGAFRYFGTQHPPALDTLTVDVRDAWDDETVDVRASWDETSLTPWRRPVPIQPSTAVTSLTVRMCPNSQQYANELTELVSLYADTVRFLTVTPGMKQVCLDLSALTSMPRLEFLRLVPTCVDGTHGDYARCGPVECITTYSRYIAMQQSIRRQYVWGVDGPGVKIELRHLTHLHIGQADARSFCKSGAFLPCLTTYTIQCLTTLRTDPIEKIWSAEELALPRNADIRWRSLIQGVEWICPRLESIELRYVNCYAMLIDLLQEIIRPIVAPPVVIEVHAEQASILNTHQLMRRLASFSRPVRLVRMHNALVCDLNDCAGMELVACSIFKAPKQCILHPDCLQMWNAN